MPRVVDRKSRQFGTSLHLPKEQWKTTHDPKDGEAY
jgi:hypothetical protein